jgi:hypothetical protein
MQAGRGGGGARGAAVASRARARRHSKPRVSTVRARLLATAQTRPRRPGQPPRSPSARQHAYKHPYHVSQWSAGQMGGLACATGLVSAPVPAAGSPLPCQGRTRGASGGCDCTTALEGTVMRGAGLATSCCSSGSTTPPCAHAGGATPRPRWLSRPHALLQAHAGLNWAARRAGRVHDPICQSCCCSHQAQADRCLQPGSLVSPPQRV